jgi:hypothetical protein
MLFKELEQTDNIKAKRSQGKSLLLLLCAYITQKCHRGTFKKLGIKRMLSGLNFKYCRAGEYENWDSFQLILFSYLNGYMGK